MNVVHGAYRPWKSLKLIYPTLSLKVSRCGTDMEGQSTSLNGTLSTTVLEGAVVTVTLVVSTCAITTLICYLTCCDTLCKKCHRQGQISTPDGRTNGTYAAPGTGSGHIYQEAVLQTDPPPSYSKIGLYKTDKTYDKRHHTYLKAVDSNDVSPDTLCKPPPYESHVKVCQENTDLSSEGDSKYSHTEDEDDDNPIQMRQVVAMSEQTSIVVIRSTTV